MAPDQHGIKSVRQEQIALFWAPGVAIAILGGLIVVSLVFDLNLAKPFYANLAVIIIGALLMIYSGAVSKERSKIVEVVLSGFGVPAIAAAIATGANAIFSEWGGGGAPGKLAELLFALVTTLAVATLASGIRCVVASRNE
ncbi:hypothetical protein [Buchananella felis]|uniref:hypothetical protein n=1 Tax=Buchananella felis TaxID=3231492 RepID=UPI0035288E67